MSNYSSLTDFQINYRVLSLVSPIQPLNYPHNADGRSVGICDKNDLYHWWDFCNDWSDAGPLIEKNLIEIKPVSLYVGGHRWFAYAGEEDKQVKSANDRPLRAAMEAFLLAKENTND